MHGPRLCFSSVTFWRVRDAISLSEHHQINHFHRHPLKDSKKQKQKKHICPRYSIPATQYIKSSQSTQWQQSKPQHFQWSSGFVSLRTSTRTQTDQSSGPQCGMSQEHSSMLWNLFFAIGIFRRLNQIFGFVCTPFPSKFTPLTLESFFCPSKRCTQQRFQIQPPLGRHGQCCLSCCRR